METRAVELTSDVELLDFEPYGSGDGDGSGNGNGSGSGSGSGYGNGNGSGSGSGSGYGNGDGDGDGSGNGDGDGDGSGNGDGDGDGSGNGSGNGNGNGSGSGSGYGYGNGDGNGDGYGYGDKQASKRYFHAILRPHQVDGCHAAFWRCTEDGGPANGGRGTKAVVGVTERIEGPLEICTKNALHATVDPQKWKGTHWWIVALHEPIQTDEDKLGSLERTFLADLGKCPFPENG